MSSLHTIQSIAMASALALTGASAWAQTDAEHAEHHPTQSASKPVAKVAPKAKESAPAAASAKEAMEAKETMVAMDNSLKAMHGMHEKMMAAKTPEERKALMAEHMKAMQEGMAMMGKMNSMAGKGAMGGMGDMHAQAGKGGMGGKSMDMGSHHQMMEKRMEMMSTMMQMMQMMLDRMPASPAQ